MKDRQSARQTVHESSLKSEADLAKSQVSEGPTRVADSRTQSSPPASLMVRCPWHGQGSKLRLTPVLNYPSKLTK